MKIRPGIAIAAALSAVAIAAPAATPAMKVSAAPAASGTSECGSLAVSQALLPFGDVNLYRLVPNGSFESGLDGWTITGTGTVTPDPAYPGGPITDTVSLELSPGARAVSPPICANAGTPVLRFFQRSLSPEAGTYAVDVSYLTAAGGVVFGAQVSRPTASWGLTPQIVIRTNKIVTDASGWGYIRVGITAPTNATLRIDDIYLDPKMR